MTTREEVAKLKLASQGLERLSLPNPYEAEILTHAKSLLREVIEDLEGNHTPPSEDEQTFEDVRRVDYF